MRRMDKATCILAVSVDAGANTWLAALFPVDGKPGMPSPSSYPEGKGIAAFGGPPIMEDIFPLSLF